MEQYTYLAQIYDKMIDIDYDRWIDFIKEYFNNKGLNIKGKKALELGCGTGNMSLRLKDEGVEVVAFDNSRDMLTIAEEKARKRRLKITFLEEDMVEFSISKSFDFIFSFCDGYNYIIEPDEVQESFKRVYKHLNNGGYFVFDISTPHKLKNVIGNNTFTLNEDDLCYIWDNYIEEDIIEMYITFFVKEGMLYRRFNEIHTQRAHSIDFIIENLKRADFTDIEVYEDYSFNKCTDESIRATFIARKQEV